MAFKVFSLLFVFFAASTILEAECGDKVGECICTKIYAPVCGKNGVTYANRCLLRCAHVPQACEGVCPCKPKHPKHAKAAKRITPFKSRKTQRIRKPRCTRKRQRPSTG